MKKITFLLLLILVSANYSYSQMKMNFWLANGRDSMGYYLVDLRVTVLPGQVWRVGACNIRVTYTYTGSGSLTVIPDNPALNANRNISDSNGYQAMNTTSVAGAAIGLNILGFQFNGFYTFTPGTYRIATLRWLKIPPISTIQLYFRVPPATFPTIVYDSTVLLIYNTNYTVNNGVNIKIISSEMPKDFLLSQNYPNPFNPTTKIKFDIANPLSRGVGEARGVLTVLKVYDITGREILTLVNEKLQPGTYEVTFDGSNLPSGIYFYRLETPDFVMTKKMLMIK